MRVNNSARYSSVFFIYETLINTFSYTYNEWRRSIRNFFKLLNNIDFLIKFRRDIEKLLKIFLKWSSCDVVIFFSNPQTFFKSINFGKLQLLIPIEKNT